MPLRLHLLFASGCSGCAVITPTASGRTASSSALESSGRLLLNRDVRIHPPLSNSAWVITVSSLSSLTLRRFLSDPNITFVGVSNKRDSHLLRYYSKHELCVGRLIDLVDVASEMRGYGKVMSMEKLAGLVLGMEGVRKDPAVGKSNWDEIWLSDDQVEYACVDAFISFLLGKSLKAWNWNREDFDDDDGGFYHDDDDSDESY